MILFSFSFFSTLLYDPSLPLISFCSMFVFSFLISFFSLFLYFSLSYSCSINLFSSLISFCSFLSNVPMFPHLCFFLFCLASSPTAPLPFPLFSKLSSCSFRQLYSSFLLIPWSKTPLVVSVRVAVHTFYISLVLLSMLSSMFSLLLLQAYFL